jgi:glycine/D-amino acid oxidase-like deaminating enzyme
MASSLMAAKIEREINAGDVLIVGAGVTGTLLAIGLLDNDLSVTLVDQRGFGAAQSGHSHGYLHQGYIYRHGEQNLINNLWQGAQQWQEKLRGLGVDPVSRTAHVCFSNILTARAAASAWRETGLPVTPTDAAPRGLRDREIEATFLTEDATYDFSRYFNTVTELLDGFTLTASIRRLERSGDRIRSVIADLDGCKVRLNARTVVLAAGDQNAALAETATRFRGRAIVRSSLMVVLRHPDLPMLSTVLPENEAHGLFIVSRQDDGATVWLVSNFVSFAEPSPSPDARETWLNAIVDRLVRYCAGVRGPDVEWGIYDAPKAELRSQARALGAHAFEPYATENMLALAPTKLTLAPLLAKEAAERLAGSMANQPAVQGDPAPHLPLAACPERWRSLSLKPRDEFFASKQRARALSTLVRYVRTRALSV